MMIWNFFVFGKWFNYFPSLVCRSYQQTKPDTVQMSVHIANKQKRILMKVHGWFGLPKKSFIFHASFSQPTRHVIPVRVFFLCLLYKTNKHFGFLLPESHSIWKWSVGFPISKQPVVFFPMNSIAVISFSQLMLGLTLKSRLGKPLKLTISPTNKPLSLAFVMLCHLCHSVPCNLYRSKFSRNRRNTPNWYGTSSVYSNRCPLTAITITIYFLTDILIPFLQWLHTKTAWLPQGSQNKITNKCVQGAILPITSDTKYRNICAWLY